MPIERLKIDGMQNAPTFSQVVRSGNLVFVAGQTATDAAGNAVAKGDITGQTEMVMQNMQRCLAAVGADFSKVVKTTVYITDARYREAVGAVRNKYFAGNLPASTLVVCAGLAQPEYLVEIEAIAVLD